jgi:hypothetical protein
LSRAAGPECQARLISSLEPGPESTSGTQLENRIHGLQSVPQLIIRGGFLYPGQVPAFLQISPLEEIPVNITLEFDGSIGFRIMGEGQPPSPPTFCYSGQPVEKIKTILDSKLFAGMK